MSCDAAAAEWTSCGGCYPRTRASRRRCCRCTGEPLTLRALCAHTRSSSASRGLSFSSLSAAVIGFRSAALQRLRLQPRSVNDELQGPHRHHALIRRSLRPGALFLRPAPRCSVGRAAPLCFAPTARILRWATPAASYRLNGAKVNDLVMLIPETASRLRMIVPWKAVSDIVSQNPSSLPSAVILL